MLRQSATIKDVARRDQVSTATVSRVLNKDAYVCALSISDTLVVKVHYGLGSRNR